MLARTVMCLLLLGTRMIQQSMRNVLGPLLVFMGGELTIGIAQKGTLLSAIAAGYFFTQVPGGALADRFGAKNVITGALVISAICCLAVPIAADHYGLDGMWAAIALMGAAQGPLFPASSVFLSRWMPKTKDGPDEKAWGTSMLDIGISVGSLIIIPLANMLAESLGWRNTYHAIGLGALGFVALWHAIASESPSACKFIGADERKFLDENVPKPKMTPNGDGGKTAGGLFEKLVGLPLAVAVHPGLWAVFVTHVAFNFGAYYMTNWNPTYYTDVLRMSPAAAKYHLSMPHISNLVSKALNPTLVALVQRNGVGLLGSRRLFTSTGFVLAAGALLCVYSARKMNPWVSTVLFSLANSFFGLAPSGFKSNYLDITEQYVGIISGYGNTLGTMASWAGPQLVAMLLQNYDSWALVLLVVATSNVLVSLFYLAYATVTPIEQLVEGKTKKDD